MSQSVPIHCSSIRLFLLRPHQNHYQVLLLQRKGGHLDGKWSHISGGIEPGEQAWEAAVREAMEETGISLTELYTADYCEQYYQVNKNQIYVAPVFVAYVHESTKVILNDEHHEFCWVSIEKAREMLAFPSQREGLKRLEEAFIRVTPPIQLRIDVPDSTSSA